MPETVSVVGFQQESFDAFLQTRDEPGWVTDQRRAAWDIFESQEWPRRNEEEWIRTDIRLFKPDKFSPPGLGAVDTPAELPVGALAEGVELAGQTVSCNGKLAVSELSQKWRDRGVLFGGADELVREHADLLRPYLMARAYNVGYDRFAALHAAYWSGGAVLYVPRGVALNEPLHSLALLGEGGADFSHLLVILEDGAEATLMTETASLPGANTGLHCGAIELYVAPNARLRFVSLQDWAKGVWHFAHQKAIVDRDASLQWTLSALGSRLSKVNQHVALVGPGAESQVNGTMFTEGRQHLSYHTLQHHQAPNCRSDFLYKAALQDESRTVWRGMIKVDPKAQKTDGYQRNDNLILSSTARADSIPGLEIEADDVRCTHGSTSGRVDEELIFYAQCRGFTRKEAVRMIVTGFFQQIFDRITIESVREALGRAIARQVREYE
jgi:Fe-S cluster assembly protein SufD